MQPLTKRQREILDYLQEFIQQHGYAPSLEEVGRRFNLSSLATVHKHLTNLQEKGFIRRSWNRSRSVELLSARTGQRAIELPLLGYVAAGLPIEAVASAETIAVPEDLVGKRFNLSSLATVHKHLTNLQEKGFIKRAWNRSRSVELVPTRVGTRAVELPMLGFVAAGMPIEAVAGNETIAVPEDLVGRRDTYVLRVRGNSMIDEQIRDGDYVIVEDRRSADNGEMVIALVSGTDVTLKKFYRENGRVRLQPANPAMQPIMLEPDRVQVQGVVVGVMRKY